MASNPVGVAIVTGGSSGIGLALTNHLIAKKWHVFVLDVQPPVLPLLPDASTFIKTNVADWDELAAAFHAAHAKFSRLDFCALNAGIDDRDDIFDTISRDPARPPRKPNMLTFEVNLFAPYYGLKLAAHYMSLNPEPTPQGGKIVITSSVAAFAANAITPQYNASKYGALGLSRAVGATAAAAADIRVNCLCPAMVATGLAPPGLLDVFPDELVTPMSTMLRAFDELADFDGLSSRGGRAEWVKRGPTGAAVEGSLGEIVYREPEKRKEVHSEDRPEIAQAWVRIYGERNRRFAQEGA